MSINLLDCLRTLQDHYSTSGQLGPENRRVFAESADEIERLLRLIAWCRPRLSRDVYRTSLDEKLANPRNPDDLKMVQS
jgi:hypothetical protein